MAEPKCEFGQEIKAQFPYIKEALDKLDKKMDKWNGRIWKLFVGIVIVLVATIFTNMWRG